MGRCEKEAMARGVLFEWVALRDMRPAAVTDRQEEGDDRIIDATGHADERGWGRPKIVAGEERSAQHVSIGAKPLYIYDPTVPTNARFDNINMLKRGFSRPSWHPPDPHFILRRK